MLVKNSSKLGFQNFVHGKKLLLAKNSPPSIFQTLFSGKKINIWQRSTNLVLNLG